jgi:hypothetical protein
VNGGDTSRKSVFDLPEHTSAKVNVMFHEPHSAVLGPALPIIITNHVFVVWIRIFSKISLNKLPCFIFCKFEKDIEMINISQINPDWMLSLQLN